MNRELKQLKDKVNVLQYHHVVLSLCTKCCDFHCACTLMSEPCILVKQIQKQLSLQSGQGDDSIKSLKTENAELKSSVKAKDKELAQLRDKVNDWCFNLVQ